MLKTNTKKAKENIKNYIIENFDYSSYENYIKPIDNIKKPQTYQEICEIIYKTFESEKFYSQAPNNFETFKNWCQGLPSILDTCYYYNRSAKEDLKNILEETNQEANKYTEEQAEEKLTYLLYREIIANK